MKIAFYIEDGVEQIVLTPQNETEKRILAKMHDGSRITSIYRGTFYGCRGGWTRHADRPPSGMFHRESASSEDDSTIVVLAKKEAET